MPGASGSYNLTDIVVWRLRLERRNERLNRPQNEHRNRMQEIEVEKAEIDLQERQKRYQEREGQLALVSQVEDEVRALVVVTKSAFRRVPRSIIPKLPASVADAVVAEIEKKIRHALTALSEKAARLTKDRSQDSE